MNRELKEIIGDSFTQVGEGCFIESILLKTIEDIKIRSIFTTLQKSDKTKFNFVLLEDSLKIWNCQELVKEVKCNVKFNLAYFKWQAIKNTSGVFMFRSAYYSTALVNVSEATQEENQNS
jgi:hypothetical protein